MSDNSIGATGVTQIAEDKLGKTEAHEWLWTPNPALDRGVTPVSLLDSGCPTCIDQVLELLEAM